MASPTDPYTDTYLPPQELVALDNLGQLFRMLNDSHDASTRRCCSIVVWCGGGVEVVHLCTGNCTAQPEHVVPCRSRVAEAASCVSQSPRIEQSSSVKLCGPNRRNSSRPELGNRTPDDAMMASVRDALLPPLSPSL
jgi:hypothetical protein